MRLTVSGPIASVAGLVLDFRDQSGIVAAAPLDGVESVQFSFRNANSVSRVGRSGVVWGVVRLAGDDFLTLARRPQ